MRQWLVLTLHEYNDAYSNRCDSMNIATIKCNHNLLAKSVDQAAQMTKSTAVAWVTAAKTQSPITFKKKSLEHFNTKYALGAPWVKFRPAS